MNQTVTRSANISVITNPDFGNVRSVTIKGDTWFVAKDLCDVLGHSNNRKAISDNVYPEDKADVTISDGSQNRQMTIVNESGLYSLIMKSRLEAAKSFQRWVTSEVLPAIRKQGFYVHPSAMLSKREINTIERVMVQNVSRFIIAEDIRKCAKKFGVQDSHIRNILYGRSVNNDIMIDLQERALINRQKYSNAYSVERMQMVTKKLTR